MNYHLWIIPLVAVALAQLAAVATSVYLHRASPTEPWSCTLSPTSVFGRSSGSPQARIAGMGGRPPQTSHIH